ncbi:hypothetical protein BGX26_010007 [Mortierella sp. AD094]|nr:hypothetical protein BGX26_010007 [Mortierella sp. AD094]
MGETQSFRLIGKMDIVEITVDHVGGGNIIYWEDIEQVFPRVQHAQSGKVAINMLRDSDGNRIVPRRIKQCPGVVLDVVFDEANDTLQVTPLPADTTISNISVGTVWSTALPLPLSSCSGVKATSTDVPFKSTSLASTVAYGSLMSTHKSVDQLSIKSEVSMDLGPSEPLHCGIYRRPTIQIKEDMKVVTDAIIASNREGKPLDTTTVLSIVEGNLPAAYGESIATLVTVVRELKALHELGTMTQQIALQVWELQKQMNDRLIPIERKTAAILTQNYELLEYTILKLFIVLPETSTSWDPKTMFRTRFRLHFICECGEHTMPADMSSTNRQSSSKKYGPFLMLMLEMIKMGTGIAGHVVPALASLKVVDIVDSVQSTIDTVTSKVIEGVDYSLAYLEENRTLIQKSNGVVVDGNARASQQELARYLAGVEGLEGVDLRQLGSYLTANSSYNLLGRPRQMGLPRALSSRSSRGAQKLRDVVKLNGGKFDEQLGRIEITLRSSFAAAEFYDATRKAKGVLDLDVSLRWNQDYTDFIKLKNMISKLNVRSIRVDLNSPTGFDIDSNSIESLRYDPIFEILRLPSMESFEVIGVPKDFFKRPNSLPKKADLSKLRRLRISGPWTVDGPGQDFDAYNAKLVWLVAKPQNLTNLHLDSSIERLPAVFSAIAKYQTYLIIINDSYLHVLPPTRESRLSKAALQDLPHLFKVHGARLETLDLEKFPLDDLAVEALAGATRKGSNLKRLYWRGDSEHLSGKSMKALADIVAQSELIALEVELKGDDTRVCILESIQWKFMRSLDIIERHENQERAMRALLNGMEKMERVGLETFHYDTVNTTAALQGMSVDLSRLESLYLRCDGWSSSEVQIILDALQHAGQLRYIRMIYADITKHKEQMHAKGIKIESTW